MVKKRKLAAEFSDPKLLKVHKRSNNVPSFCDDDGDEEELGECPPRVRQSYEQDNDLDEEEEEIDLERYEDKDDVAEKDEEQRVGGSQDPCYGCESCPAFSSRTETGRGHEEQPRRKRRPLFAEDYEIKILNGIIKYFDKNGISGSSLETFHAFMVDHLSNSLSISQLEIEIKRLEDEYRKNALRTEHGRDLFFFNPHEQTLFSLSKRIWGITSKDEDDQHVRTENQEDPEENHVVCNKDQEEQKGLVSLSQYPRLSESLKMVEFSVSLPISGLNYVKEKLSGVEFTKAEEFEEKWRKLQVAETEVRLMRAQLIREQTELILASIK